MFGVLRMDEDMGSFVSSVVVDSSDQSPPLRVPNVVVKTFLVGAFYVVTDIMLMVELSLVFNWETRAKFARCVCCS